MLRKILVACGLLASLLYLGMNIFIPMAYPGYSYSEQAVSGTDTLNIVFSAITVLAFLLMIGFSAGAFGKNFRIYAISSLVLIIIFLGLTALQTPKMEANLPTPLLGVWERMGIGLYMLWMAVVSVLLLKQNVLKNAVT